MIKKTIEVVCFDDNEKQMISTLQMNVEDICRAEECSTCPFRSEKAECFKEEFTEMLDRLYNYRSTNMRAFESKE